MHMRWSNIIVGLGTYTFTVTSATAGMITVQATASENPPSGLSIALQKNGSPVATSTAPTTAQGTINIQTTMNCVATDVISVVITSSAAIDNQLNTVKTLVTLRQGSQ